MIKSFADTETEKVFRRRGRSRKLPGDIQSVALRKLRMLNNAHGVSDVRLPPGNRLETLSGTREGQHSIRINDQWRDVTISIPAVARSASGLKSGEKADTARRGRGSRRGGVAL